MRKNAELLPEKARPSAAAALEDIVAPLLLWYKNQARILPWRENPLPYHVWISEIMLQQTRVEAVKPYFDRFITALPTIRALAEAPEDELLKLWEGLGYYNRARNLQKAARDIIDRFSGELPASFEKLLTLPGIGRYTAGAVASIAYGIPVPAVDGNVLRVITRVLASREDIMKEKVKREIEAALAAVMPAESAGDFNQALMELGAMVCLPKGAARCPLCPIKRICLSRAQEITDQIPVKSPKKARRVEEKTVFLFLRDKKAAFLKRPASGLLAGMWEPPNAPGKLSPEQARAYAAAIGMRLTNLRRLPEAKHVFTHIEWHMIGYAADVGRPTDSGAYRWISAEELAEGFAVPTAFKAYTRILLSGGFA